MHNKLRSLLREYYPALLEAFTDKRGGLLRLEAGALLAAAPIPRAAATLTTTQLAALLRPGSSPTSATTDPASPMPGPLRPTPQAHLHDQRCSCRNRHPLRWELSRGLWGSWGCRLSRYCRLGRRRLRQHDRPCCCDWPTSA